MTKLTAKNVKFTRSVGTATLPPTFIPYNTVTLRHTLNNPNAYSTRSGDNFGYDVVINDTYTVVSSIYEDSAGKTSSGAVYVFDTTTGSLLRQIVNPNPSANSDFFGVSISLSGNYLIVGANGWDGSVLNQGVVYIFDITTGSLVKTISNPSPVQDDNFGQNVSIDGNLALISSGLDGSDDRGIAFVYKTDTGDWTDAYILHALTNPNAYSTVAGDYFGYRSALSGNTVVISAPEEDTIGYTASGKVYIYDLSSGTPTTPIHTIENPNAYSTPQDDRFGYGKIDIDGNYAIVGTNFEKNAAGDPSSGAAYIIDLTTGLVTQTLINPNVYSTGLNDNFGMSVGISGNHAIVGTRSEDDAGNPGKGRAYVFDITTGNLVIDIENLESSTLYVNDFFGWSVDISGSVAVISATREDFSGDDNSGVAYIVDLS